jgi:rubrerythrin
MKRTFASLSPQEALHVAIFIEERNAEIYSNFAEMFAQFGDPDSIDISMAFREMSIEERRHSSRLQHRYCECYGNQPCTVTEDDLSELIEVPNLSNADVFGLHDFGQAPARERAFAVALAAERSAADFYRNLAETATDSDMRDFYREFAEIESQHSTWLEQQTNPVQSGHGVTQLRT